MRWSMRSRVPAGLALGLAVGLGGAAGEAGAASLALPLSVEFDDGRTGDFGIVQVDEIPGGDLLFKITAGPDLGDDADLHEFYFNLDGADTDGLEIRAFLCNGRGCGTDFALAADRPVRGGAGSDFDFAVSFGNGAGRKGNGVLSMASFVLGAHDSLTIAHLLSEHSFTAAGIEAIFATHVQGTSGSGNGDSETVSAIPEPATVALFALGLAGLAFGSRRPPI
jgi:hypothetical protein